MDINRIRQYVELLIREGLALKKGQIMEISLSLESLDFARIAAEEAFRLGAADVLYSYRDDRLNTLRVNHASEESLLSTPEWQDMKDEETMRRGDCLLSLTSPNRKAAAGTDPARLALSHKNRSETATKLNNAIGGNQLRWCVAAVPNPAWAKEVFPELDEQAGMDKLWEEIMSCCYMDREGGWAAHVAAVQHVRDRINALKLRSLHFTTGLGTDLTVLLIPNSVFQGGAETDPMGVTFCANMPSEEIFTSPHRLGTEGIVAASMPLLRSGELIEGIRIRFENGRAVEVHADKGEESLKRMIETDENACYLGETALVSCESPIWQLGHLFYNTLFDENAACHLALGTGFSSIVEGSYTKEKLIEIGINQSVIHCDFMFGTPDLLCEGMMDDGTRITVMKDGRFVL